MADTLFTIITVCYNSEKTIERTLRSVLAQTEKDYEYLIIDGASTDSTLDIVKRYESAFEGRLKVFSEKDNGIYDAMNKGISKAEGKLIGIINSDDYYEPNALKKIRDVYDGYEYAIIYGMLRTIKGDKESSVYLKSHQFIEDDMIAHPACFISRQIYDKFGGYSLDYQYSADYEFMLRIRNEKIIHYYPLYEIIANFSTDGASSLTKGYMDTMRLKRNYGLIGGIQYYMIMLKCMIALSFGR